MITGVLIAQDADHAAAAEEPDRCLKTFAPVEELDAKASALLPDEAIEMAVAEFLINGAQTDMIEIVRHNLGEQFPVAEMTERDHHRLARAQLAVHFVRAFGRDQRRHFRQRHGV